MWKLLIVDDEPLVATGLATMLHWSDYDVDVCALAYNGHEALQLIEQHKPDIVITDIKMPIITGIELMKICQERFGSHPVFILLSSYEDFSYAKEAIHYDAVEYLLKMELTKDMLVNAVMSAVAKLKSLHYVPAANIDIHQFYDKFLIRLLYHLFETPEQYFAQAELLGVELNASAYACTYCMLNLTKEMPSSRLMTLSQNVLSMMRELLSHYCTAHVVSLDMEHMAIIFCLNEEQRQNFSPFIINTLRQINQTLHSYFNLQLITCTGSVYASPLQIAASFYETKQHRHLATKEQPIYIYTRDPVNIQDNMFYMEDIHELFSRSLTEYDSELLNESFERVFQFINDNPTAYPMIFDATSNFLFLAISLLPEGENVVINLFDTVQKDYRELYQFSTPDQLIEWLNILHTGLLHFFGTRKKDHKKNTVFEIQRYLQNNLNKKLSLNEVANTFGLSPNYLSSIFKKTCECSFTEYINQCKINEAKRLFAAGPMKIYEISHQLGFDDAFYFSKVFKKIEGCSPKEYIQNLNRKG